MIKLYRKLSSKYSLGIMLMAAPIFLLSLGVLYYQSRKMIHNEVTDCYASVLNTTQHRIRNYMNTIETAANSNVWMLEENFRPDSMKSVSNRIVRLNPNVASSSVFVVPGVLKDQGELFSLYTMEQGDSVVTFREKDYDYLDKAFYTLPVTTGQALWIDPYTDNAQWGVDPNKAIATYCRPIKQDDGRIMGVVTADMQFRRLGKMINETGSPYPNAFYMLLSADGRYLIHPDSTRLFRKTIFTDADPNMDKDIITLGYEMTSGRHGTMHVEIEGQRYHVCYQPVEGTDWSLALVSHDYDAMHSFYNMGFIIIALIVVGLLIILLMSYHAVKQVINPINALIVATKKMADGNFGETIPESGKKGFISKLHDSFVTMQQALNTKMDTLQKNADNLRLRNEQLDKSNQQVEDVVNHKYQFIRNVTQQIRMPLNVITGFADILVENATGKDKMSKEELSSIMSMMKTNTISMNQMTMMLLDATETDTTGTIRCTKEEEVSCNKIARECIRHTQKHFPEANIRLLSDVDDSLCLLTNYTHLGCILNELLYNAAKYSDGQHVDLVISQTESSVRMTVQDIGPGLPADLPQHELQPFAMPSALPEAVGLGLPLVKQHVRTIGGTMIIDTDYFAGCRITIEMPR